MRKWWWTAPTLVALAAIAGLAYWGLGVAKDRKQLVTYLNNRNQGAYYEMLGNVQNMEVMLSKGIVSNSPQQKMMIFADIWQQAYAAQSNLTRLPTMNNAAMTRTSKFLVQTGDFTWSLAKKYARGQGVSTDEVKQLNRLHTEAGYLATELQKIDNSVINGKLGWGDIAGATNRKLQKQAAPSLIGMEKLEKNMQDFPTLIYDGPYSDHIMTRNPRGLTGGNISGAQAGIIARNFIETAGKTGFRIVKTENVNGVIPAFRIHLVPQNSARPLVIADISKKGGHVLQMLNTRVVNRAALSRDRAVSIAQAFLVNRGIKDMESTYVIQQQNSGIVLFEYKQDGVLVYPDLMKVKVALDTGEVVGFEGTGFVMNHHAREIAKPAISEQEALAKVNPQLKITSKRLVVIPLENLSEVLAYEFRGNINGDIFVVYINAKTGNEERIIKVLDTSSGPVTM